MDLKDQIVSEHSWRTTEKTSGKLIRKTASDSEVMKTRNYFFPEMKIAKVTICEGEIQVPVHRRGRNLQNDNNQEDNDEIDTPQEGVIGEKADKEEIKETN